MLWERLAGRYGEGEARAVVRYLLEVRFGLTMADILCGGLQQVPLVEIEELMSRLEAGEPVQYVAGKAEFAERLFAVSPAVLIPRPETALLCQWVIDDMAAMQGGHVLDIGTGSGCIAVTLSLALSQVSVEAWDVSADALVVANENNRLLGAQVTFRQEDALCPPVRQGLDVVVSNPPYICERERNAMEEHVLLHEPGLALFVPDDDPLRFYRAIAEFSERSLGPDGRLYFEINPVYAESLAILLQEKGFTDIHFKEDQFGKVRFVRARKSEK